MTNEAFLAGDRPVIDTVFVVLGRGCNLSCRYCLQHDLVDALPAEVDPSVPAFIRRLAVDQGRLRVQLYGGEPLVYMDAVRELVDRLADVRDKLTWTMITNGRLLDDAAVAWCNAHLDGVAVSWDGPASVHTRGYDVVAQRRAQLLSLRGLTLTGVVSALAYPLDVLDAVEEFSADYRRRWGTPVGVNLDELLSTTTEHPELADMDFEKVRNQVLTICGQFMDLVLRDVSMPMARYAWISRKVRHLRFGVRQGVGTQARCGNGYTTLNVDLAGNLYACHNAPLRVGVVTDPWADVYTRVVTADPTPRHAAGACGKCDVRWMCQNGCPRVSAEDRARFYCAQVRAMAEPVVDTVLALGDALAETEVVGDGPERKHLSDDVHPGDGRHAAQQGGGA